MKHIENSITHPNFHLSYAYDHKNKDWVFLGWRCIKCERTIKFQNAVEKHAKNCKKGGIRKYGVDPTPITVIDMKGQSWKPFDFNQIPSDGTS